MDIFVYADWLSIDGPLLVGRKLVDKYAISSKEQDLMETAFELVQR